MTHDPDFSLNDVHLLKIGRHFRLNPRLKLVVGRNEDENQKIQTFSRNEDLLFKVVQYPGPLSLLRGEASPEAIETSAEVTLRYSKGKELGKSEVTFGKPGEDAHQTITVSPVSEARIKELIISE
jgi:predicted ribosome quality control (RQC) complex YloA/Tae2 family protein